MNKELGRISEIVKKHDDETFPKIMEVLDEQTNALKRMESKQNKDIVQFNQKAEELHIRLKPLEEEHQERILAKKDTSGKLKNLLWDMIKLIIATVIGAGLTLLGINTKP